MSDKNWANNAIQFPRLLAKIMATQDKLDMQALAEAMDLSVADVSNIFDRANSAWEAIKGGALRAFQVSDQDIRNVLDAYSLRVTNTKGKSFETMAAELLGEIDCARVEKAALESGVDVDDQANGAFNEIRTILVEIGVLEF